MPATAFLLFALAVSAAIGAPAVSAEPLKRRTSSTISSKKGVGYNAPALTRNLAISWAYNWDQTPGGSLKAGVEYVPMLWSANAGPTWAVNAQAALDAGSTHLLAFNEPDLSSQAHMTVNESVAAWKKYMSPFAGKARLGSMAVTNGGSPMGIAYLQAFFEACPQCKQECDFVCLHWYDQAWNVGYYTGYLTDAYKSLGKPIWLTEFAGAGTVAEQQTFFQDVIPWMESQDFMERYAGFGDFVGTYVNADGSLTPLGETYSRTV